MGSLYDFLQRNQILRGSQLPLVHSTEAYLIKKYIRSGAIKTSPCSVFKGENLSYFFVGRPAFKRELGLAAEYWELPMCVIMEFSSVRPKRVFPFDSGAFAKKLYPSFINMMQMEEFEVSYDPQATEKIIGTFFSNNRNYYNLKSRPKGQFEASFEVEVLDEEVKALHKLIETKSDSFDDRRFAIELQSENDVHLNSGSVMAVILPESYIESQIVFNYVTNDLSAKILTYPIHSLKKEYHYYAIYQLVYTFLSEEGYFRV